MAGFSGRVGPDGTARLEPRGDGHRRVSAIALIETFTAQRLDTWRRLKICRNEMCSLSFYDRSPNNSAVYHDSRVCGNAIYLRASRARKRQGALNTKQTRRTPESVDTQALFAAPAGVTERIR